LFHDVKKLAKLIESEQGSLIGGQAFRELVVGAQRLAKLRGLI
jgi:hypothetical protein